MTVHSFQYLISFAALIARWCSKQIQSCSHVHIALISLLLPADSQGSRCQRLDNTTAVSRAAKELKGPRGWIKPISSCQSPQNIIAMWPFGLIGLCSFWFSTSETWYRPFAGAFLRCQRDRGFTKSSFWRPLNKGTSCSQHKLKSN